MRQSSMQAAFQSKSVHCIIMTRLTEKLIVSGAHKFWKKGERQRIVELLFYNQLIVNDF
ncbi:hypothetical protein [Vreelandella janggokensis]|uniref:Uncharacterized protein n=1 Tax=Vreelandella janggokensis TaxID=370767 RepID=A0ABT4IYF6_9GAMM|nr:hypothetical protein [Halomonas janggokensis]MCZ0928460.1 hypothetical protein [Halomonas janggokensis]